MTSRIRMMWGTSLLPGSNCWPTVSGHRGIRWKPRSLPLVTVLTQSRPLTPYPSQPCRWQAALHAGEGVGAGNGLPPCRVNLGRTQLRWQRPRLLCKLQHHHFRHLHVFCLRLHPPVLPSTSSAVLPSTSSAPRFRRSRSLVAVTVSCIRSCFTRPIIVSSADRLSKTEQYNQGRRTIKTERNPDALFGPVSL